MIPVFLSLILGLVTGLVGAYYARSRGRRPEVWFVIGLLFGLLGILVLFLLPRYDQEQTDPQRAEEGETEVLLSDPRYQEWFFLDSARQQKGPVSFRDLFAAWHDRVINAESYVWTEGMAQWEPIRQLPGLFEKLRI